MKKPTLDLEEEHGGIMLMLKIMGKVAERLKKGDTVDKGHLRKIVDFLKNFADKCHHGKEEDILFPELIQVPSNKLLVNELLGEHKTGRDFIRGMEESLEKFEPGNADAFHIMENAQGYIHLLTGHIHKENTILFPLAERQLTEQLQAKIEERFETLERDVIGLGKHEEYHSWLDELRKVYLG